MKFRISSILWLTLAVACFFAGMHWDEFYAGRKRGTAALVVNKSVTLSTPSGLPISRLTINDPTIATATVRLGTVDLLGESVGTTTVSLWDEQGARTDYSVAVKPSPIVAAGRGAVRLTATAMVVDPK